MNDSTRFNLRQKLILIFSAALMAALFMLLKISNPLKTEAATSNVFETADEMSLNVPTTETSGEVTVSVTLNISGEWLERLNGGLYDHNLANTVKLSEVYYDLILFRTSTPSSYSDTTTLDGSYSGRKFKTPNFYKQSENDNFIIYGNNAGMDAALPTVLKITNYNNIISATFEMPITQNYSVYMNSYYFFGICEYWREKETSSFLINTRPWAWEMVDLTSNYTDKSIRNLALSALTSGAIYNDYQLSVLQNLTGEAPVTDVSNITVNYKSINGFNTTQNVSEQFQMNSLYAYSTDSVISAMYQTTGRRTVSDFNVIYKNYEYVEDGQKYLLDQKILMKAISYNYSYTSRPAVGTLTIIYDESFSYTDLSIKLENNDANNLLSMYIYSVDVNVGDTQTEIIYTYDDIEEQLLNSCHWIFDLSAEDFIISGTSAGVTATAGENSLIVVFNNSNENSLRSLTLRAVAEIVEDVEYNFAVKYADLTIDRDTINITYQYTTPEKKWYSDIVKLNADNIYVAYKTIIDAGINPDGLDGCAYLVYSTVTKTKSADGLSYYAEISYTKKSLFAVTNNINNDAEFIQMNNTTLSYTGEELITPFSGYRVQDVQVPDSDYVVFTKNDQNYRLSKFDVKVNTSSGTIISINVTYSDFYPVKLIYLVQYKDTCFAEKKVKQTTIKVSDCDIDNITSSELTTIFNLENFNVLKSRDEKIITTYDSAKDCYTFEIIYTFCNLISIDYDGNRSEVQVPLTSWSVWTEEYAKDWSIMFLNMPEQKNADGEITQAEKLYFKYSNDVLPENLYGYFCVAVFKEQVTDINYYFQNNTGDGCQSFFNQKEVSGSNLYKFSERMSHTILAPYGYLLMAGCEIVNDDSMYKSFFFYLDCTSNMAYASNGGATSATDGDGAIVNTAEILLPKIAEWFANVKTSFAENFGFWITFIISLVIYLAITLGLWYVKAFKNKKLLTAWLIFSVILAIVAVIVLITHF